METDPKAAMDAWLVAKKGLEAAESELKSAKAGYEVAARCEREAWEAIAKMCGREPIPEKPPQAPPVAARVPYPHQQTYGVTAGWPIAYTGVIPQDYGTSIQYHSRTAGGLVSHL